LKVFLSYILFFALAIRPIYNVGYIAYFELNVDYIIKTYCVNKEKPELKCNGKCHLATQLSTSIADTSNEAPYLNTLFETFVFVYFQAYQLDFDVFIQNKTIKNNWNYSKLLTSADLSDTDRPPQA